MNSEGFTKLLPRIVRSTIWFEDDHVLRVWIMFLALVDKNGFVSGSVPGMAHTARVTMEEFEKAIEKLESPDPFSTTKDNEGRRIKKVDQGWVLLNFKVIRDQISEEERKEYQRTWDRENRGKRNKSEEPEKTSNGSVGKPEWSPTPEMIRLGELYNRRPNTKWSDKEKAAYRAIGAISEDDLLSLKRYYSAKQPEGKDYRRTSLLTLLNNFTGELDRARKFELNKGY